ncbi:MAG: AMP-binding protein [Nitrolancea sp.]
MKTLIDLLQTARASYSGDTALSVRSALRDDAWTYERLWQAACSVAHFLHSERGILPGDRMIVWAPNSPQLVAIYFGAMLARIVVVPLDPTSTQAFIQRVVTKTRAAAIVAGFSVTETFETSTIRLDEIPFASKVDPLPDLPGPDDVAEIVFTSGTTGAPKGVILTHRNIVASVESVRQLLPARPYRLLSFLPLSHMLEQTVGLYVPLLLGSTIVYPTGRGSAAIRKALKRHRITTLIVVPRVLSLLLDDIERDVDRQHRRGQWQRAHQLAAHLPIWLRRLLFRDVHAALGGGLDFVICGGAYLEPSLAAAWERLGVRAIQGYGATECAPIIATNSYWRRMPGSVGRPAPGVFVRLSHEDEILVKGANVTPGYWEDDERTREAFTDDGWFRTGDLGELDASGDLFLKGRLKDLIVLPSGLKVYPEDVERELESEPGIQDCVVLGIPNAGGVMEVHAVVIAEAIGSDESTALPQVRQAVRRVNARLAPHQRIVDVTLWTQGDFPRTNLFKVKRSEVLTALQGEGSSTTISEPPPAATSEWERLCRALSKVCGVNPESIDPDTDLTLDLNLDSLSRVELAMLLEEESGVSVEDGDLAEVQTVGQLQALLERSEPSTPEMVFQAWPLSLTTRILRDIVQRLLLFPIHRLMCHSFVVGGRAHLDELTPPVLLIANHSSHVDTPTVLRALPPSLRPRVAVAAAADYFYHWRLLGFSVSFLLNTFPFSREGAVRSSLEHCGELVGAGWSILIYPEGTRSPTGKLQPFRSGIGVLASQLQVPVVPVAIKGTYDILPKGRVWPRRGRVVVSFGEPIQFQAGANSASVTTTIERAVASLAGSLTDDVALADHDRPTSAGTV